MLSLGQLYTDDTNDDADNDDDNDTQWTNHDYIASLACMPNKPKISTHHVVLQVDQLIYILLVWLTGSHNMLRSMHHVTKT